MWQNKFTVSNILIVISIFFTLLTAVYPDIYKFGMNDIFFDAQIYYIWMIQMFTSQFIHGGIIHLLMNAFFILYFWNVLEKIVWSKKMLIFFILNSLFLWVFLTFMWAGNTVGISWFALAILTYYTLLLKKRHNPEYRGGITAIIINILIWISPGISFLGHLWGMIFGAFFFFIIEKLYKKASL